MKFVITLVHGNRPKASGRLAPGSFLRRELERRLANVTFREFAWHGTNTHAARIEAGDRLTRFIRDGHEQHPDARHFIVAHSHGGNVALYAMRDAAACKIVDGIVTLGTPFIHTRRRDLRRYADVVAWLVLLVAVLVPLMVFDALSLRSAAVASLLGGPFLIVTMKPRLSRWLIQAATPEQDEIVTTLEPPTVERGKLAIFCARGDEAATWLRIWKVVAEAPIAVACVVLSLVAGVVRFNLPIAIDQLATSTGLHGLDELRVWGFDGLALTSGVLMLSFIWMMALVVTSVVRRPGYWREPLLANMLVEIGTDSVPRAASTRMERRHDNPHQVCTFDIPPQSVGSRLTREHLRHTAICEDPAVVSSINDWIVDRAGQEFASKADPGL